MMRSELLVPIAASVLLASGIYAQTLPAPPENLPAKVDALFQKMDSTVSPGCSLSVMKDGKIIYERGYGMADLDHNIANTPTTVFHVASMSKQITAASILLLAQQGKLSLDDPARKYIPELPDFGTPVTIRQLIHHTSGLRDQWDLLGLSGWRYSLDLITNDDVLYVISHQKELNFPPGTKHLYSNTGYTLLGEIVKRVSGKSLREFTTANIFEPLGMKSTHFRDDHAEIVKNIAYGYAPAKDTFKLSVTNFDTVGATSLMTTVEDLALWDENFYNSRVGGPELVKQMLERGKLNSGEQLDYASGLVIGTYRGLNTVDHGGADAGYRSDLIRFPDQHFSSACLCNIATADPSDLNRKVAEIYLAKGMKPAAPVPSNDEKGIQLTPDQLKANIGIYLNQDDEVVRIFVKDNKLYAGQGSGDESYELKALAPNHFRLAVAPVDLTFDTPKPGAPAQLTIKSEDGKPDVSTAVPAFTPSESDLIEYAGAYSSDEIDPLYSLKIEEGKLVLHRLKADPDKLMPVTRDLFASSLGSIRFTRTPKGEIGGFLLTTGRIHNLRFSKGRPAIPAK
ncbi:serine hydrolase [Telmatobacter sp. DSM 110680]|uniref:Serine hydrolase n=1 Tax=Telmatobacter sp. DSM 110680 TaxID=3036704 RepID=A0AAU7DLW5_9BACT